MTAKEPMEHPPATDKAETSTLTQSERFMQAARDLGCDDDPERFKQRVKKLATVSQPTKAKNAGPSKLS